MAPELLLLITFLVIVTAYFIYRVLIGGHEFRRFSGKMVVTCPETHQPAGVEVASGRAALAAAVGKEHVELSRCSRWPEREGCDQACLNELKANPEEHSVWTIASKWYTGKTCVYCGRPISRLSHLDHTPALLEPNKKILEWEKVAPEKLPEEFVSARPVCWNCSIVEGFRQRHPELVIERPRKH